MADLGRAGVRVDRAAVAGLRTGGFPGGVLRDKVLSLCAAVCHDPVAGHVVLAIVVKEALLAVVLLVRLVPSSSAMMALSLLLADLLLTSVFLLYIRVSAVRLR